MGQHEEKNGMRLANWIWSLAILAFGVLLLSDPRRPSQGHEGFPSVRQTGAAEGEASCSIDRAADGAASERAPSEHLVSLAK